MDLQGQVFLAGDFPGTQVGEARKVTMYRTRVLLGAVHHPISMLHGWTDAGDWEK